jgi:hypothetical protein
MRMNDARRPGVSLDSELDLALARTVRRAAPADLRARVMAGVAQGPPSAGRPLALWTAVAAAAVVTMIAAHALRRPVAPLTRTANEMPVASAAPVLRAPRPAGTPAGTRGVATPGTGRRALTAAIGADRPRLAGGTPPLDAASDAPAALIIDPLEHPAAPIVPLHTDDLVIAPLVIEDAGSLSTEDRP